MQLRKIVILSLVITLGADFLYSQPIKDHRIEENIRKNNFLINFLADASMINVKYERSMMPFNFGFFSTGIGAGIGVSGQSNSLSTESIAEKYFFVTVPHHFTANFGGNKHFFEAGVGATAFIGSPHLDYLPYPTIGYRFQNSGSNQSVFRFFVQTPIGGNPGPDVFFIPFGFSIGTAF